MNDSKDSAGDGFEVSFGNKFPMINGIKKKHLGMRIFL